MINRRRFQQMEVLEGLNILVTISGRKNKLRVYTLSWLKTKILKTESVIMADYESVEHLDILSAVRKCSLVVIC